MSLPPDPHEDDLADPGAAALATGPARPPSPPPVPPPASPDGAPAPGAVPPPPPPTSAAPTSSAGSGPSPLTTAVSGRGEPPGTSTPTGPAASGARRGVLVAVGAVAALAAVVGGAVIATRGSDDDETSTPASADAPDGDEAPATPEAAAEALFAAARTGDCEAVIELMAPEAFGPGTSPQEAVAECEADVEGRANLAELEIVDITLVSESENDAVVAVTGTVDGETSTEEVPLRRVDGTWMVAALG
jgi:hypothetical protein